MARAAFRKGRRRCIFCDLPRKITKEHIWPRWVRPYVDFDTQWYVAASAHVYPDRHEIIASKQWGGDPRSRGVPVVCEDCNTGWMSGLQQRVKPFLLPMIRGERYSLTVAQQEIMAAWASMAIMTGEFFFPDAIAVSPAERLAIAQSSAALTNWKIWAGTYVRGDWQAHFAHSTRPLLFPGDPEPQDGELPPRNTQTTSFVVGQIYFHAFSCSNQIQTAGIQLDINGGKLAQIWPPVAKLEWPMPLLSDLEADRIAGAIFEVIDQTFGKA